MVPSRRYRRTDHVRGGPFLFKGREISRIKNVVAITLCFLFISTSSSATVCLISSNSGDLLKISVDEGSRVKIAPDVYKYQGAPPYPYIAPVSVIVNCKSKLWKVDSVIHRKVDAHGKPRKNVEKKLSWGWEYITIKDDHGGELCK
jgi:hypothetical protein